MNAATINGIPVRTMVKSSNTGRLGNQIATNTAPKKIVHIAARRASPSAFSRFGGGAAFMASSVTCVPVELEAPSPTGP